MNQKNHMRKKLRSLNQIKEDQSFQILRNKLPKEWVIHSYGSDYGIDCVIELFDFTDQEKTIAETLGENIFVQLKSSTNIKYIKRKVFTRSNVAKGSLKENKDDFIEIEVAKFQLDISDILTIQSIGPAIPVLLVLVDVNTSKVFFINLNDYIDKVLIPDDPNYFNKKSKSIYIPLKNEIFNNENSLIPLRAYGKRSKMYGAFAQFNFQWTEIKRLLGKTNFYTPMTVQQTENMIRTFINIALRQDIWKSHDFWEPMKWSFKELNTLKTKLDCHGVKQEDYHQSLIYCEHVWHRLANLANIYEELVREWFLPTYLAQLTSYP